MVLIRPEEKQNMAQVEGQNSIKVKTPKRVLHFSDGILEEYSTDEEDNSTTQNQQIDPATMTWGPWFWLKAWSAGNSTLNVVDTIGEFLSSVFGITTPRYYFELEEYKRREEQKRRQNELASGWSQPTNTSVSVPLKDMGNSSQPIDV
ncbi:protein FAM177A1 [Diorhabda sublineata]|uniref:protein FAM177A1 n=1 Tax=Diorhabda sublineata TaxID=1163346 RepID=UPI0024E144C9|nr:protein FAM177A1 [Diorhabda sublineata]